MRKVTKPKPAEGDADEEVKRDTLLPKGWSVAPVSQEALPRSAAGVALVSRSFAREAVE